VDVHRPAKWDSQQSPTKKHRTHSSIAKGLLSFIEPPVAQSAPHSSSYQSLMLPAVPPDRATVVRTKSIATDSTWDIVEDLPLRWATDYVGLAAAGSRLLSTSVNCYSLWRESTNRNQSVALLAVATRSNIVLYEKPKGERAFRFVKVGHLSSEYSTTLNNFFLILLLGILYPTASSKPDFHSPVRSRCDAQCFRRGSLVIFVVPASGIHRYLTRLAVTQVP